MFFDSSLLAQGHEIKGVNYAELVKQVDLNQALVSVKPNPFMPGGQIVQQVCDEAGYDADCLHPKVKFYVVPRYALKTTKTVGLLQA